jgi:hypothetical protein
MVRWNEAYIISGTSFINQPKGLRLTVILHRSVHHDIMFTTMTNKMQLCKIIYCSLTVLHVSSAIFAHHQEHLHCNYSFWFYSRVSWSAAVMVDHDSSQPYIYIYIYIYIYTYIHTFIHTYTYSNSVRLDSFGGKKCLPRNARQFFCSFIPSHIFSRHDCPIWHWSASHGHLYKQRTVLLSINYTKQNYVLYVRSRDCRLQNQRRKSLRNSPLI